MRVKHHPQMVSHSISLCLFTWAMYRPPTCKKSRLFDRETKTRHLDLDIEWDHLISTGYTINHQPKVQYGYLSIYLSIYIYIDHPSYIPVIPPCYIPMISTMISPSSWACGPRGPRGRSARLRIPHCLETDDEQGYPHDLGKLHIM